MLDELLLALLGYTGHLIIDERDHQKSLGIQFSRESPIFDEWTFKLAPDISFVDPSERNLIQRLVALGFNYRELDRFAMKSRNEDRDVEHGGSYPDISEKLARLSTDDTSSRDWHLGFHIFLHMLPEYIHMRIAESILSTGKAIRVLRNPSHAFQFQDTLYLQQMARSSQKIQGLTGRFPFQKKPLFDTKLVGEELLPQSEPGKIKNMLQELKVCSLFGRIEHFIDALL